MDLETLGHLFLSLAIIAIAIVGMVLIVRSRLSGKEGAIVILWKSTMRVASVLLVLFPIPSCFVVWKFWQVFVVNHSHPEVLAVIGPRLIAITAGYLVYFALLLLVLSKSKRFELWQLLVGFSMQAGLFLALVSLVKTVNVLAPNHR